MSIINEEELIAASMHPKRTERHLQLGSDKNDFSIFDNFFMYSHTRNKIFLERWFLFDLEIRDDINEKYIISFGHLTKLYNLLYDKYYSIYSLWRTK